MGSAANEYDVFISYAHEDRAWVSENLYKPLLRCQTADGRRPRVFFDIGDEGISIGESFMNVLVHAILNSKKFLPVYSRNYFDKKMCQYELTKAHQFDPGGESAKINPILIDPAVVVPIAVNHIHYGNISSPDWFPRLCKSLGLIPAAEQTALKFLDQPADVTVSHTLPPLRVAVVCAERVVPREEQVTVAAEAGRLEGTLTVKTEGGVATFADLSMSTPVGATRLVASAYGHEPAHSEPFA
nr:toll/interleukin-1 receptor domain-containing protein [Acidobacteriota bacterium]